MLEDTAGWDEWHWREYAKDAKGITLCKRRQNEATEGEVTDPPYWVAERYLNLCPQRDSRSLPESSRCCDIVFLRTKSRFDLCAGDRPQLLVFQT